MKFKYSFRSVVRRELRDIKLAGILLCVLFFVWFIVFRFRFNLPIGGDDNTESIYPFLDGVVPASSSLFGQKYYIGLLGGVARQGIYGSLPIDRILAALRFTPVQCLNAMLLSVQFLWGFVGSRFVFDLRDLIQPQDNLKKESIVELIAVAVLILFSPAVGWRISYGHPSIILGALTAVVSLGLVAARQNKSESFVFLSINFFTLLNCFQTHGFQMMVYAFFFSGPVVIGQLLVFSLSGSGSFLCRLGRLIQVLVIPTVFIFLAILVSSPLLYEMIQFQFSSDSLRGLTGTNIVYSFVTEDIVDLVGSIPLKLEAFTTRLGFYLVHETNYPFGPLASFLFLMPKAFHEFKNRKYLFVAMTVTTLGILTLSMNSHPFSDGLLWFFPPLRLFRIPGRAILLICMTGTMYVCSATLACFPRSNEKSEYLAFLAPIGLYFVAPHFREPLVWIFSIFTILLHFLGSGKSRLWLSPCWILLCIGLVTVSSFRERLFDQKPFSYSVSEIGELRSQIIHQSPSLSSPLVRAVVTSKISGFAENRGYILGVSTLDGYSYPLRRYLVLIETLRGQKYDPLVSNIEILPGSTEFQILKQLYNVRYRIEIEQGTAIVQFLESPTAGEAWFSLEVKTEPGVDELVKELKKWAQDIHSKAAQQLLLDESDLVIQKKKIARPFSSECALSRVNGIGSLMTDQSIGIQVFNPSQTCPLTVSMNYSDVLKATGRRNDGTTLELLSFPSYGSLMGVLVEPGIQEVFISTRS